MGVVGVAMGVVGTGVTIDLPANPCSEAAAHTCSAANASYLGYTGDPQLCHCYRGSTAVPLLQAINSGATITGDQQRCHYYRRSTAVPLLQAINSGATITGDQQRCHYYKLDTKIALDLFLL